MAKNEEFTGLQKAAILLITLGPERSADIFKHLKEDEIEELTLEIANTRSISPQVKEDVLNEFYQICLAQQYIAEGGIGYAKELLDKALGADKAQEVISKLIPSGASVRVCAQDRSKPAAELHSGRTSADHCHDSVLSDSTAGVDGSGGAAAGKTGGCRKTYRDDGSYIAGCYQGSGAGT